MLTEYHIEIMLDSLAGHFSAHALSAITMANIYQDRIRGQFGHDEYHFDNNAFERSHAYIEEQRALTLSALQKEDAPSAWSAFGRLTHSVQDFYAHSNYISLWLSRFDGLTPPTPPEVDSVDGALINNPHLHSGKVYYPLETLYFVRKFRPLSLRLLPGDSHAWVNLDSPEQGFKFYYAMQAAVKRTVIECEKITFDLSPEMCKLFLDR